MRKNISLLIVGYLLTIATLNAQNPVAQRQQASEKLIPKAVVEKFKGQYQGAFVKGWYVTHLVYWMGDYSSDWYNGWYGQRTVVVYTYEKPNYFEVEFIANPGELSRAIYNRFGNWHETRTQIKGLTMGIYDALKASKYNKWEISRTMEKLESPDWPMDIYRFQVSKGVNSLILRMDEQGNIIQVKDLDNQE